MLSFPPSKDGISQPGCWYQEVSTNETPPSACRNWPMNKSNTALKMMSQSIPQQEKADWHMVKRGTLIFFFPIQPCIFKVLRLQMLNLYF